MLSDGRMLVFGGFSQSEDTLLPFSSIWALDTTQSSYSWSAVQVSTASLPTPRRGFVAAALTNGMVLIQGGASADMQTVYSDGWILDTTKSPMEWTSVDVLSQVGQRRDHFAVAVGTEVIIGFGMSSVGLLPWPSDRTPPYPAAQSMRSEYRIRPLRTRQHDPASLRRLSGHLCRFLLASTCRHRPYDYDTIQPLGHIHLTCLRGKRPRNFRNEQWRFVPDF